MFVILRGTIEDSCHQQVICYHSKSAVSFPKSKSTLDDDFVPPHCSILWYSTVVSAGDVILWILRGLVF